MFSDASFWKGSESIECLGSDGRTWRFQRTGAIVCISLDMDGTTAEYFDYVDTTKPDTELPYDLGDPFTLIFKSKSNDRWLYLANNSTADDMCFYLIADTDYETAVESIIRASVNSKNKGGTCLDRISKLSN